MCRAGVHGNAVHIQRVARSFDQTTIATLCAATRRQVARHSRRIIGPQHHTTTIALGVGIGMNSTVLAHVNRRRVWHGWVLTLVVTADQHHTTTDIARSIHVRIEQAHMMRSGHHTAPRLTHTTTHIQSAAHVHRAGVHAAQQHNRAIAVL